MELAIQSHRPLVAVCLDPLHGDYRQIPGYRDNISNVGQSTQRFYLFSIREPELTIRWVYRGITASLAKSTGIRRNAYATFGKFKTVVQ